MHLNKSVIRFLANRKIIIILSFFASLALFGWLQSEPVLGDPDSFYHARMGQILSSGTIIKDFPWQTQTILQTNFADQHFLYHLVLVPFMYFWEPLIAVKVASAILGALLIAILSWYLSRRNIKYSFVYLLILLTAYPFLTRLTIPKATPLAILLFILGIYFWEEKKRLLLFIFSILYTWAHGGFLLLFLMAIIYIVVEVGLSLKSRKKIDVKEQIRMALIIIAGIVAGIIINPYFPQNLFFYWQQVIQIGLINYQDKIGVGAEWYPYQIQDLIGATSNLWIFIVLASVIFIVYIKHQTVRNWQWLALSLFFLAATIKSRRFAEYFIPIVIIWCGYVYSWYWQSSFWPKHLAQWKQTLQKQKKLMFIFIIYLVITIPFSAIRGLMVTKTRNDHGFSISFWQNASNFLKSHSPKQTVAFHGKWDEWPMLFYYNQHNYYIVGLDATFMYKKDKNQYQLWQDVVSGYKKDNLADIIKKSFNAKYALFQNKEKKTQLFQAYLERDKNCKKIYEDEDNTIYEIQ